MVAMSAVANVTAPEGEDQVGPHPTPTDLKDDGHHTLSHAFPFIVTVTESSENLESVFSPCPNAPCFSRRSLFLFSLFIRILPLLLFPRTQTYFQPDEFWQVLEPAHRLVFGSGYLSWEWRDQGSAPDIWMREYIPDILLGRLKAVTSALEESVKRSVSKGSGVPWIKQVTQPVVLGYNPKLGINIGNGIRGWLWPACFAIVYWIIQACALEHTNWLILAPRLVMAFVAATTDFYTALLAGKALGEAARETALFLSLTSLFHAHVMTRPLSTSAETCLNVMALYYWPFPDDRIPIIQPSTLTAQTRKHSRSDITVRASDHLNLSLTLSAIAFVLRPTNGIFWSIMGVELVLRTAWKQGLLSSVLVIVRAGALGFIVLAISTLVDWLITGHLSVPAVNFLYQNVVASISTHFGTSPWHYHLTQTIPILLTSLLPFAIPGWIEAVFFSTRPAVRTLGWSTALTVTVWSFLSHKEWRFLHPLLPVFIIFATRYLMHTYSLLKGGALADPLSCAHAFLRINRGSFVWLLTIPIVPWIYLTFMHGKAQIEVLHWLRDSRWDQSHVLFAMPCHSTPWMSHLHASDELRYTFLTCEPPLDHTIRDSESLTAEKFFASPKSHLRSANPDGIVLFGHVFETHPDIYQYLIDNHFTEQYHGWNGFDMLQDDPRHRGGVHVWMRTASGPVRHSPQHKNQADLVSWFWAWL